MTLGERIKFLRKNNGLTQLQLSQKLDTSKSNISKYEADIIEPNIKTLTLLSNLFHVSTDYLIGLTDNINVEPIKNALSADEQELVAYYNKLSQIDKRWIMGQIIDLIKKEVNTPQKKVVGK